MHNAASALYAANVDMQKAFDTSKEALRMRKDAYVATPTDTSALAYAASLSLTGSIVRRGGHYDKAFSLHKAAFDIRRRVLGYANVDTARSANNVGLALWDLGRKGEAYYYMRLAYDIGTKLQPDESRDMQNIMENLAMVTEFYEDFEMATKLRSRLGAGRNTPDPKNKGV